MKHLLTLFEQDINPSSPRVNRDHFRLRKSVRAVVFDEDKAVALLYPAKHAYYKLPGGA